MFLSDVHSLGVQTAHGMQFTQSWYWDQTDATRAWSERYQAEAGTMPNDTHAATYSAALNYLRAVAQANTDEAHAVMKSLKSLTITDVFARDGHVREDGRMMFDRYLTRVKDPDQSNGEWDELEILRTIPAAEGFRPLTDSDCPFIKA
jgi:branched-chain amino acid transport system substrate-binding protein